MIIPVNGLTLASMVASEYLVNKSSVLTVRVKGPGGGGEGGGGYWEIKTCTGRTRNH